MYDTELTVEERRCLRMWFRQAIAHAEMEDAKRAIVAEHATTHNLHSRFVGRRTRRSRLTSIARQYA
jgi:hypothetical protein